MEVQGTEIGSSEQLKLIEVSVKKITEELDSQRRGEMMGSLEDLSNKSQDEKIQFMFVIRDISVEKRL